MTTKKASYLSALNKCCRTSSKLNTAIYFLVVHINVNYRQEILIFECIMHVNSEKGHSATLERSSITDCTIKVLGLGSGAGFFCDSFSLSCSLSDDKRSCRGDRLFLYHVVTCWMHYKLLRVMLGGSTEIKLTAEYKQESKGNGSQ